MVPMIIILMQSPAPTHSSIMYPDRKLLREKMLILSSLEKKQDFRMAWKVFQLPELVFSHPYKPLQYLERNQMRKQVKSAWHIYQVPL